MPVSRGIFGRLAEDRNSLAMHKKTLVLGASLKPERYSNMAIQMLRAHGHPVVAHGLRKGRVADVDIQTEPIDEQGVDTITVYLGPANQGHLKEWVRRLKPTRVIMNPGTENPELEQALQKEGPEVIRACTLVLLRSDQI